MRKNRLIAMSVMLVLSQPLMADDNSDGKKPRISDIQTVYNGDNITLTINGVDLLGKKNAVPYISMGNGRIVQVASSPAPSNTKITLNTTKSNLPAGDYLVWLSKDDKFKDDAKSVTYGLTVGALGQQGSTGDTGAVGPAGPQGAPGAVGPQGPKGETGLTGAAGPAGAQGTLGPVGPQGPKGDQGLTGAAGAQGAAGAAGQQGPKGAPGVPGAQGPAGEKGGKGDKGDPGDFPTGTVAGDMQYWDGTQWVMIPKPTKSNSTLHFCGNTPTWSLCYTVGSTGPANGIVFYVDNSGGHGLEAWPSDESSLMNWEDAIYAAVAHGPGWHLPTQSELASLYQNRAVVGGFGFAVYWSATEHNALFAWYQLFSADLQGPDNKFTKLGVRAVRAF